MINLLFPRCKPYAVWDKSRKHWIALYDTQLNLCGLGGAILPPFMQLQTTKHNRKNRIERNVQSCFWCGSGVTCDCFSQCFKPFRVLQLVDGCGWRIIDEFIKTLKKSVIIANRADK